MTTKEQLQERKEAQEQLRKVLKPGQDVYTILRHVSKSGMSRNISVVIVEHDAIRDITYLAAKTLGEKISPTTRGIKVSGCGMDMGFEVVCRISYKLFQSEGELNQLWL